MISNITTYSVKNNELRSVEGMFVQRFDHGYKCPESKINGYIPLGDTELSYSGRFRDVERASIYKPNDVYFLIYGGLRVDEILIPAHTEVSDGDTYYFPAHTEKKVFLTARPTNACQICKFILPDTGYEIDSNDFEVVADQFVPDYSETCHERVVYAFAKKTGAVTLKKQNVYIK